MRRFYFHYNKPASLKAKRVVMSIHFGSKCLLVDKVVCFVQCESHNQKRQPRCIMRGFAHEVVIDNGVGFIQ